MPCVPTLADIFGLVGHRAIVTGASSGLGVELAEALAIAGLVATVGRLDVSPGADNVIAGSAQASLDARHADDAVRLLQGRGLKARRLDVGFPEWRRAGRPVEIAS